MGYLRWISDRSIVVGMIIIILTIIPFAILTVNVLLYFMVDAVWYDATCGSLERQLDNLQSDVARQPALWLVDFTRIHVFENLIVENGC